MAGVALVLVGDHGAFSLGRRKSRRFAPLALVPRSFNRRKL